RADTEDHVMPGDHVQILALVHALGLHDALAALRARLRRFRQPAQRRGLVSHHHAQQASEITIVEGVPGFAQVFEVGKDLLRAGDVLRRAIYADGIRIHVDGDVQAVFHDVQIFVAGAEQGLYVWGDL